MLTRPAGLLSVPKTTSTRLPPLMERTWSEKPPWRVAVRFFLPATRRNQLPTDEASAALEDLADFEAKHVASSAGDKSKALHDFSVATLNVGAYMLGDKEAPTDELRRGRAAMHGAGFAGFDDRALLRRRPWRRHDTIRSPSRSG